MAKFLLLHTVDPMRGTSGAMSGIIKGVLSTFTKDTYCIATWVAGGAGKIACLWEAPSEQAIIDAYPEGVDIPVEGIYPATVVDWAEVKKMMAGGQ